MPQPIGINAMEMRMLGESLQFIAALLVAWFATMALTGWLAGRRGWDDGLWTVLAVFIGPLALLAVLLVPRRPRLPADASADPDLGPPGYSAEFPIGPAPRTITRRGRVLGALIGAAVGIVGAAVLVGLGKVEGAQVLLFVGAASPAIAGWWLGPTLLDADVWKMAGAGIAASFVVLSIAGFLIAIATLVPAMLQGASGFEVLPLTLPAALLYPFVVAVMSPEVLVVSVPAGVLWAAATRWLLHRGVARSSEAASSSERWHLLGS